MKLAIAILIGAALAAPPAGSQQIDFGAIQKIRDEEANQSQVMDIASWLRMYTARASPTLPTRAELPSGRSGG